MWLMTSNLQKAFLFFFFFRYYGYSYAMHQFCKYFAPKKRKQLGE